MYLRAMSKLLESCIWENFRVSNPIRQPCSPGKITRETWECMPSDLHVSIGPKSQMRRLPRSFSGPGPALRGFLYHPALFTCLGLIIIFLRQKPTLILDIKKKKKGELPSGKKNYWKWWVDLIIVMKPWISQVHLSIEKYIFFLDNYKV